MKYVMYVAFAALLTIAPAVNAGLITVGNIQSDDATSFMTDTTTGRMYSRLDATIGRSFSQLTTIDILTGGSWDGWSVATSVESDDLIRALLGGVSACDGAVPYGLTCGAVSQWTDGALGNNWDAFDDYWIYLSTYVTPARQVQPSGLVGLRRNGNVNNFDDWTMLSTADSYTARLDGFGFLLFKDGPVHQAPAPPSLAILALGLIGFAARRFKKQQC